ncbi:cell wall integrity and stress response component [Microdochium nivale]|nr:cell wall integrity and stress response component [Microdochium nivale]
MSDTSAFVCLSGSHYQSCSHLSGCCSNAACSHSGTACPSERNNQTQAFFHMRDDDHDDDDSTTTTQQSTRTRITTTTVEEIATSTKAETLTSSPPKSETTEKTTTTTKRTSTKISETEQNTPSSTKAPPPTPSAVTPPAIPGVTETNSPSPTTLPNEETTMSLILPPGATPSGNNTAAPTSPSIGSGAAAKDGSVTAIAAGVGGAVGALIMLAILIYFIRKRRHTKRMSSTRGSSPLHFDDKTGTAEGGPDARTSLRVPLQPGPVEFLSHHHTSVASSSTNGRSHRTAPNTDARTVPPQYFRAGSLGNRAHPYAASHQPAPAQEPSMPLVSPLTPTVYARDGLPIVGAAPGLPYEHPDRAQSPAINVTTASHVRAQRQSSGRPCHHEHDDAWPTPSPVAVGPAAINPHEDPADYISPLSPDFVVPQAPMRPQFPGQAARGSAPFVPYRPGASRSSSANSSHHTHNTGYGYYTGHNQARTPPPGAMLSQDRMVSGLARSMTPRAETQGGAECVTQYLHQSAIPVQGRPRLMHINSSGGASGPDRVPTPANSVELPGSEIGVAVGQDAGRMTPTLAYREGKQGDLSCNPEVEAKNAHVLQIHRAANDAYRSFSTAGHQQQHNHHPPQPAPSPHQGLSGPRADMNASDTDRLNDQFVTSWQKL